LISPISGGTKMKRCGGTVGTCDSIMVLIAMPATMRLGFDRPKFACSLLDAIGSAAISLSDGSNKLAHVPLYPARVDELTHADVVRALCRSCGHQG